MHNTMFWEAADDFDNAAILTGLVCIAYPG
jgi:hypothetical protein